MANTSHHYSLGFEPNYVFVNGEAILRKHWSFADGQLEITYELSSNDHVMVVARGGRGYSDRSEVFSGGRRTVGWVPYAKTDRVDELEAEARKKACKEAVTRAVDHMVDQCGFTLDQTMAISAMFTAMIESHEAT